MSESMPDRVEEARATGALNEPESLGNPEGAAPSTTEKPPAEWVTGDEPMTGAQQSYLSTLAREAGEQVPADLTKAAASEHIDRLRSATGKE